jgi:hypothetical protein
MFLAALDPFFLSGVNTSINKYELSYNLPAIGGMKRRSIADG